MTYLKKSHFQAIIMTSGKATTRRMAIEEN